MALEETLELDAGPALSTVDNVGKALEQVARTFGVRLADSLDVLQRPLTVDVDADTAGLTGEVTGAVDAADTDVTITGDASELTGDVTGAVDAGDSHVVVTGDASELTGDVTAAIDAADTHVTITGDASQLDADLSGAASSAGGLDLALGNVRGVLAAIAGGAGVAALAGFIRSAGDAASDLEESTSKTQAVFRSFSGDVFDFGERAATAIGLSNQEALEATGTFGNLFTALGLSREEAAKLSPEIVTLGADLASFNNLEIGGPEGTLAKLRSGLVGEIEPLRQLGVSFNAAEVEARALQDRLPGVTGAVTEQEKIMARYSLILEQSANANGDFARTSEGLANQTRILQAEFGNLLASLGTGLLPTFKEGVAGARDFVPALQVLGEAVVGVVNAFAPLVRVVAGEVSESVQNLDGELDQAVGAFTQLAETAAPLVASLAGVAIDGLGPLIDAMGVAAVATDDLLTLLSAIPGLDIGADRIGEEAEDAGSGFDVLSDAIGIANRAVFAFATLGLSELAFAFDTTSESGDRAREALEGINAEADRFRSSELIRDDTTDDTTAWTVALNEAAQAYSALADATVSGSDSIQGATSSATAVAEERLAALREAFEQAGQSTDGLADKAVPNLIDFRVAIEEELAKTQEFLTNISLLIQRGADETAAFFIRQGEDAAAALAETVALDDTALAEKEEFFRQSDDLNELQIASAERFAQLISLQAALAKEGVNVSLAQLGNVDVAETFRLLEEGTATRLEILRQIGVEGGEEVGEGIGQGMTTGLQRMTTAIAFAARDAARAAIESAKLELQFFSPSRVFQAMGVGIGEGLVVGIDSQRQEVADAAAELAKGATDAAVAATAGVPLLRFEDNAVATPGQPGILAPGASPSALSLTIGTLRVEVPAGTTDPQAFGAQVGAAVADTLEEQVGQVLLTTEVRAA